MGKIIVDEKIPSASKYGCAALLGFLRQQCYSESMERPIQAIMKVSSKPRIYLPIFFSNSMVDRKVDS